MPTNRRIRHLKVSRYTSYYKRKTKFFDENHFSSNSYKYSNANHVKNSLNKQDFADSKCYSHFGSDLYKCLS